MTLSRRNLFKRGGQAAVVAAITPVMRHMDVAALDKPENAADLAAIPEWKANTENRSPAVCPTCYQPAMSMAQLVNYDAWVLRCEQSHTWKVSGLEIVKMPSWMQREWTAAWHAAKLRPPDRVAFDAARGEAGTINAMDYYNG